MRPEGPKIETEGREPGWGSWAGDSKPTNKSEEEMLSMGFNIVQSCGYFPTQIYSKHMLSLYEVRKSVW